MSNETQEKSNIPVRISLEDTCEVLNLSRKTIKEYCKQGKLNFKVKKFGKRLDYFIYFSSLPKFAKNKFLGMHNTTEKYSEAPSWAKIQVEKYFPIVKASKNLKGGTLLQFIKTWNDENPNCKTSYSSLIRMRRLCRLINSKKYLTIL